MIFDPAYNTMFNHNSNDNTRTRTSTSQDCHGQPIAPSPPSASIPLPASHVTRTQSEVQLALDQEAAEHRETLMFYRLVNGIRARQQRISPLSEEAPASVFQQHHHCHPMTSTPQQATTTPPSQAAAIVMNHHHIVAPIPAHPLTAMPQQPPVGNYAVDDSGWSIAGFDTDPPPPGPLEGYYTSFNRANQQEEEQCFEDDQDEGVFDLEL